MERVKYPQIHNWAPEMQFGQHFTLYNFQVPELHSAFYRDLIKSTACSQCTHLLARELGPGSCAQHTLLWPQTLSRVIRSSMTLLGVAETNCLVPRWL